MHNNQNDLIQFRRQPIIFFCTKFPEKKINVGKLLKIMKKLLFYF